MTPEPYTRRYFGSRSCNSAQESAIPAEEFFPSCPLTGNSAASCDISANEKPGCCCKDSMDAALRLLCSERLNQLVDFDSFFFLTDALTVGGTLTAATGTVPADNISAATASLRRFSLCSCDLLEVSGTAYYATPAAEAVALDSMDILNVCALKAVAFQLLEDKAVEACECPTVEHQALRRLRQAIRAAGGNTDACVSCQAHCDCANCCCVDSILTQLSFHNLSRQATLTAGPLVLSGVTVLGSLGSVLVLWNETKRRVYLVCSNAIEVLG